MGGRVVATIELPDIVAAFGHALHGSGVPVTPERSARFGTVITLARPTQVSDVYWLGRVTLLTGQDQVETYDRVFQRVFRGIEMSDYRRDMNAPASPASTLEGERYPRDIEAAGPDNAGPHGSNANHGPLTSDGAERTESSKILAAMSQEERLTARDFAECSEQELALIRSLVERLPLVPPPRTGLRSRRHPSGARLDVRQTLRRSHRTGGDPVVLIKRRRTRRPRRVVLIADVSGSMEPYSRIYLHLMRGAVQALHAEAFVFATRLTRLTRALALTQPDVAYRKAVSSAPDWSGGTRIGRALSDFLTDYGRRGLARGAVVVIVSDGWEVEDAALVGETMQRLSRLAHHIVWVNPRKAADSYEPLVGGMAAALPYVDTFVSGHSVRALADVMSAIEGATDRAHGSSARRRVAP